MLLLNFFTIEFAVTAKPGHSASGRYRCLIADLDGLIDNAPETSTTFSTECGQGPCIDAAVQHRTVYVPDLLTDDRWPELTRIVRGRPPIRSSISFELFTDAEELVALNDTVAEISRHLGDSKPEATIRKAAQPPGTR